MAGRNIKIVFTALDKTATGIRKVTQSITRVGMKLAKVTAGFAAAGAAASAAIVRAQLPVIDALGKTSDRLGLTTQAMGGLQHAADLAGVAQATLSMALQRFNRRVSEAADGSGEAVAALHELGLDAEILEQIPLDQAMMRVADAFGSVKSSGDKTRLAMKLFDSEGVRLLDMLQGQAKGLQDAAREADKLGLTLSRVEVAQVEIANEALTKLGSAATAVKNKFTVALAPAIELAAHMMRQLTLDALGFGDMSKAIDTIIKGVWGGLLDVFHGLKVAAKFIQIGFLQIAQTLSIKLIPVVDKLIEGMNAFNKSLPYWLQQDPVKNPLSQFALNASNDLIKLNEELLKLMTQGLPSEQFANAYDEIIKKHRELAEELTKNKPGGEDEEGRKEARKMRYRETIWKQGVLKRKEFEKKHRSEQAVEVASHMSKLFAKNKSFQVAQALMDTYRGATLALSSYPPPINVIMMAATLAAGMQQVQAIRSQSFMGGGFTGDGPRSGGVDGRGGFPAILHPNESVIDHQRGMGGVTVVNNIDAANADTGTEMRIRQAIEESSQATISRIIDLQRRGRLA